MTLASLVALSAMGAVQSAAPDEGLGSALPPWLEIGASAVGEYNAVVSGGLRRRDSWRSLLSLEATADLGALLDSEGAGTLFLQAQSIRAERGGTLDSGDIQVYSNLESDETRDDIMELWYERVFVSSGARLKVGKLDANSEFDYVEVAGDFSHSSAGFSPTIFTFPSYPDPATSINLFVPTGAPWTGAEATLGYGFYDGAFGADGVRTGRLGPSTFLNRDVSDDFMHLLQWEVLTDHGDGDSSRFTAGAWRHTGAFERFDGGEEDGTGGAYLTWERTFLPGAEDASAVHVFGQYAWADDSVSEFGEHVALGVVLDAPFPGRPLDSAGLYASLVDLSDAAPDLFPSNELALDAYYRVQLEDRLWVQPEIQVIVDPGGSLETPDVVVLGLRLGAEL